MNRTIPGRLHFIINREMVYFTVWLFGHRWHYCSEPFTLQTSAGWITERK